ncbi:hypothetical protein GW17_00051276 [Ensete ventricosum]|nr:hypothetical protein GW17_00051276 [Ensete ventricosum]
MLPLRFPNSGIRAKGRPPTARPRPRSPTRGWLATAWASPQGRPTSLAGAADRKGGACRHGQLRPARRCDSRPRAHPLAAWRPQRGLAVGHPQGATAHGQPCRQQGWLLLGRVAADGQG